MCASTFADAALSVSPDNDAPGTYRVVESALTDSVVYEGKVVGNDVWRNAIAIARANQF
jgi:hypothetical protein